MAAKSLPVVFVLGATGTGKSKLAIQLARHFRGEIINADAMQIYRGLDIATNKVGSEETKLVPHHLLGFLDPRKRFTVVDFRNEALSIINDLLNRNVLPIVVGGTHYYIESLLWNVLLSSTHDTADQSFQNEKDGFVSEDCDVSRSPPKFVSVDQPDLIGVSTSAIFQNLRAVDPVAADRIHPNDRRKAIRFLEVYEKTGRLYSSHLEEQTKQEGGSSLGGPIRFPNACIFWLQTEKTVLKHRLFQRVDEMMMRGLVEELQGFYDAKEKFVDFSKGNMKMNLYHYGIFQCIGFKEFHDYLLLNEENRSSPLGRKVFQQGVEMLKIRTLQYAKRQLKWISNRFLRCSDRQMPPLYALDSSDLSLWETSVESVAANIISSSLKGDIPEAEPMTRGPFLSPEKKLYTCELCMISCMGKMQWEAHWKSKKHKSKTKSLHPGLIGSPVE